MSRYGDTNDDGVPRDESPTGAGAESPEEGKSAMDDADDAVIDKPAGGSNSPE